ncbi:MAG: four-carbon acid sugar kinase family protein [Spirosomataceae bacterium]
MKNYKPIIVLDDDPTGTQTVHGVPVITEWSLEAIQKEFAQQTPLFYVLTNSRALVAKEANKLAQEIGQNIAQLGQDCWLISRSDSTLRGHFPNEIEALAQGLGWKNDFLTVLIPAFLEGKRFTKDDVHYLKKMELGHP